MGTRQILENGAALRKRTPVFQLKHRQLTHFIQVFWNVALLVASKKSTNRGSQRTPNRLSIKATL